MMPPAMQQPGFLELLIAEKECALQLLEVLHKENRTLRGAKDLVEIEKSTAEKQALIEQLESHTAAHDRFLATLDLAPGRLGTEQYLQTLPAQAAEHATWAHLQSLIRECQDQNEINGGIVLLGRRHAAQALEILTGNQERGPVYGRCGEALGDNRKTSLANA